eukprot:750707-Hanusia_phi.AAC.3
MLQASLNAPHACLVAVSVGRAELACIGPHNSLVSSSRTGGADFAVVGVISKITDVAVVPVVSSDTFALAPSLQRIRI